MLFRSGGNLACLNDCSDFDTSGCLTKPNPLVTCSSDVPKSIPDGKNSGFGEITSTLTVAGADADTIVDLTVDVQVQHGWISDVRLDLTHGGVTRILTNGGANCSYDNMDVTYTDAAATLGDNQCLASTPSKTGDVQPNQTLSAFDGQDSVGTWTLTAYDDEQFVTGSVTAWCINVYWQ